MTVYTELKKQRPIHTAGDDNVYGRSIGKVSVHVMNNGDKITAEPHITLVPGMRQHLFNSTTAQTRGVTTVISDHSWS